jgi:hypothetical protein
MRFIAYIFALVFICIQSVTGQGPPGLPGSTIPDIGRNAIYIEIGGLGGSASINYERLLYQNESFGMAGRIGLGYASTTTLLAEIDLLLLPSRHLFETGLGYMNVLNYPDQLISIRAGYRFQGDRGLIFRFAPMYLYNLERLKGKSDLFTGFWLGLSLGYSF